MKSSTVANVHSRLPCERAVYPAGVRAQRPRHLTRLIAFNEEILANRPFSPASGEQTDSRWLWAILTGFMTSWLQTMTEGREVFSMKGANQDKVTSEHEICIGNEYPSASIGKLRDCDLTGTTTHIPVKVSWLSSSLSFAILETHG